MSGCQSGMYGQVANGKVVAVGKSHLMLKDTDSVMFVNLEPPARDQLKQLVKKDDEVTLVGRPAEEGQGSYDPSPVIEAVVLADGTRIPLN